MKKIIWAFGIVVMGALISKTASAESKCQDFEQVICNMMYAPSWCVTLSVGGEVLKKPLLAKGSNGCVAVHALRKKACDKGLQWRNLSEEEVHCVVLPR